ncbi:MAG: pyridoxamine 5'-phosphate oxidase family protein, partial [Actinomycetota bacterium]
RMPQLDRHGELEVIPRAECLALLGDRTYGRLGVVEGSQPVVLPVNYAMDGERVVFRTGDGGKFHALVAGAAASLEIDEVDEASRSGWSVLVEGRVQQVESRTEQERLEATCGLLPWAPGDRSHWMVLTPKRIGGRRVGPASTA